MQLTLLSTGEKAKITGLSGNPGIRKHLTELGFLLGKTVEVLQYSFGDNFIIALEGARYALDRKMAHQILLLRRGPML